MTLEEACAVLGVRAEDDAAEVRAAYLKLLKIHKPERDPEGFRRVRAAYERLTDGPRAEPLPSLPDAVFEPETFDGDTFEELDADAYVRLQAPPSVASQLHEVLSAARNGRLDEGQALLVQLRAATDDGAARLLPGQLAIMFDAVNGLYAVGPHLEADTLRALVDSITLQSPLPLRRHFDQIRKKRSASARALIETMAPRLGHLVLPPAPPEPVEVSPDAWLRFAAPLVVIAVLAFARMGGTGSLPSREDLSKAGRVRPAVVLPHVPQLETSHAVVELRFALVKREEVPLAMAVSEIDRLTDCKEIARRLRLISPVFAQLTDTPGRGRPGAVSVRATFDRFFAEKTSECRRGSQVPP